MFVEGGWRPPGEPPPRRPRLTPRQERTMVWLLALLAFLWFLAPIGGSTVIHAVLALAHRD